ncbi:MarR family winged helix-turn-helix transcriptional regulator [Anaerobacillus sp. 1_MG-2023]|uniref:MarR family winged helix-turn-helix transcriptional regulator n=1 Tax=Anaerobacillus sp. 1_MG-2023 TaxID=3062655 RepID=UPI0026E1646F|nr:MarR family transcriptional regulator [Anaerobacillus sp. 1_MG-2023]MDO6657784.1 MarR family transcriptional regulator [Anaerobacillus sp. 1_MG-2023]
MEEKTNEQMNEVLAMFYFAYKTFTEEPDIMIEEYGIQRVHHRILFFIARFPGLSVNELLSLLEVSKQALHRPMKTLIEKELVTTSEAEHDRRVKQLFLTDKGEHLEEKLSNTQKQHLTSIFQELKPEQVDAWQTIMEKLSVERDGFEAWKNKLKNEPDNSK